MENRMVKDSGFTLLEILVALAISFVVMAAIYSVYINQLHTANAQERILSMRQNWRAALFVMGRELVQAGYTTRIKETPAPGFTQATRHSLTFTHRNDGDANLTSTRFSLADADGDGDTDIIRTQGGVTTPIAEDIETLEFIYQLKNGTTTWAPAASMLDEIQGVRISLVAKTDRQVPAHPTQNAFALPTPTGEASNLHSYAKDGTYRQMITGFFHCRNLQ